MSNRKTTYLLLCVAFLCLCSILSGFDTKPEDIRFVRPKGWPKPVYDLSKNKITDAGFKLGRKLFYDPLLSKDGTISCANCHTQLNAFTHVDHGLSHGINGLKGTRNSLALSNLAWNTSFMWDGGINNLEVQPLAPITSPTEMGTTLAAIVSRLDSVSHYRPLFYKAFGDSTITGQRVLKALAQFIVMFESFNSKYDKYVRKEPGGDMTAEELHGLSLFRTHCESCHKEPLFTNYTFQNVGLTPDPELNDYGRMKITNDPKDSMKFKVPSLRNVGMTYPYLHDGRYRSLRQVLDRYTNGIVLTSSLAKELRKPIVLTNKDKEDLIEFLHTLTDNSFLYDSRLKEARDQ